MASGRVPNTSITVFIYKYYCFSFDSAGIVFGGEYLILGRNQMSISFYCVFDSGRELNICQTEGY